MASWIFNNNYDTIVENNYVHTQCGKNVLYMSTCIHVHACTLHSTRMYPTYIHVHVHVHACTVHAYTCIHVLYMLS